MNKFILIAMLACILILTIYNVIFAEPKLVETIFYFTFVVYAIVFFRLLNSWEE